MNLKINHIIELLESVNTFVDNKLEEKIEWNPSSYIYNRSNLEHKAEKSGYRGKIELKKGGRKTNRLFVQWVASNKRKVVGTKIKIKIDNND